MRARGVERGVFDTVLVANRGEIACRVIRSARALGLRTVAVWADADRDARHVQLADRALRLGESAPHASYLSGERVLDACRRSGAGALHPGYGFLAENAGFARACRDAGVVFVGPSPEAIAALGDKAAARRLAQRLGVPCLPGDDGAAQDDAALVAAAQRIGAPLMIKAAAGGGGRGLRRCDEVADAAALARLLQAARAEAQAAFGSGALLLERCVDGARHVEVQVFGDHHGNLLHLGERDCSTQRRQQKLIEEAPAPGVSAQLRARLGDAAVTLARAVAYVGAGTVEFLLAPDGSFWFLEVNTRLQVEHPVTEAVTGLDLVEWQLRVARGEPLPLTQSQVRWQGHAIEARLCAEDAFAGFAPQVGRIAWWRLPAGEGVRVEHGLGAQPTVTPHYDALLAKVIAVGADRAQARARLEHALADASVLGLQTNRDYLLQALRAPPFAAAQLETRWLERAAAHWRAPAVDWRWAALVAALLLHRRSRGFGPLACWSSTGARTTPLTLQAGGERFALRLQYAAAQPLQVALVGADAAPLAVEVLADDGVHARCAVDGVSQALQLVFDGNAGWVDADGCSAAVVELGDAPPPRGERSGDGAVVSPMHGLLLQLVVQPGQRVARDELLLTIDAMKMEHRVLAPLAGTVVELGAAPGTQVEPGRLLVRIEPDARGADA